MAINLLYYFNEDINQQFKKALIACSKNNLKNNL